MQQYDTAQFLESLKELTSYCQLGYSFGERISLPYMKLVNSVNRGKPIRLYRYTSFDPRNTDDIRKGRVHLSQPSAFNDFYDSYPTFDIHEIKQRMQKAITPQGVLNTAMIQRRFIDPVNRSFFDEVVRRNIKELEKHKQGLIRCTEEELQNRYDSFRNEIHCVCFSEDHLSSQMWGLYANSCKGFVAAYDVGAFEVRCCCEEKKCHDVPMSFLLCPVIYDGRYDMSSFSHVLMDSCKIFPYPVVDTLVTIVHSTIHKGEHWAYEKEWRLFCGCCEKDPSKMYANLKPVELYAGPKISDEDSGQLHCIGEELGIPVFRVKGNVETKGSQFFVEC